jgi:hypothetical protein
MASEGWCRVIRKSALSSLERLLDRAGVERKRSTRTPSAIETDRLAIALYRYIEDRAAQMGAVARQGFAMVEVDPMRADEAREPGEVLTA